MICGEHYGRVRALINEDGQRLKEAGPSVAVKVLGLNGVPEAGTEFSILENDRAARELAEARAEEAKAIAAQEQRAKITLENLFETLAESTAKVLKIAVEIIHSAVGTITESDVLLASASKGVILGFHTRIDASVPDVAKREGVQ